MNFMDRLQIGFSAFKEYILCVKAMLTNTDELVVRAAAIIKSKISGSQTWFPIFFPR